MAAPKGNEFWKMRAKSGRDKIFATPEALLEAAEEYFQWCLDNPLLEVQYLGRELERKELPKMRAFTMEGLCGFLGVNTLYFRDFEKNIAGKDTPENKEFSRIITRIREIVWQQQYEGAAGGFLNPLIVSRKLGLKEQSDIKVTEEITDLKKKEDFLKQVEDAGNETIL